MNKKLLPALVAVAFATSGAVASEPVIWGKINVGLQNTDNGATETSVLELKSNHSRLGVKGSEELDNGMTVIYHYELKIMPDDNGTFEKRNSFIGVKGNFGTVRAGRFDTAMKSSQGKFDLFGDMAGDIAIMAVGNDIRANNVVSYTSPTVSGFSGTVDYIVREEADAEAGKGISAKATYTSDAGLYLALAHNEDVKGEDTKATRLVAIYKTGAFQFGALAEQSTPAEGDSVSGGLINAQYTMDKLSLKAQYGSSDIITEGGTAFSLGADYKASKNFTWVSFITKNDADNSEVIDDTYVSVGGILNF